MWYTFQVVAVTAEFLVDSINGVTESGAISKEWVGLILLPIVGNAAEHVTAVTVAYKDKLTLSIGVAVGSSIVSQIRRAENIFYIHFSKFIANRSLRYTVSSIPLQCSLKLSSKCFAD